MSKNCAIVLAAGRGTRMGAGVNKQFLNINGKPMLYYTLNAFSKCKCIDDMVLVSSEDEMEYCRTEIIEKYGFTKVSKVVAGGSERQKSVLNGLMAIDECDIVLIHDGARPFVSEAIIEDGIRYALLYGACTCGVSPKDTIKIKGIDDFSLETPDRRKLFSVQTPQCFKYDLILSCHQRLAKEELNVTDDTMVVEKYGHRVYLYDGSYNNIKVTTMEDLIIAEKIVESMKC